MKKINKFEFFLLFLSVICITSFLVGFIVNENSAGGGGYNGDLSWIVKNIEIFKNNNLYDSIFHSELFGNRTPLIYVINTLLNPFFFNLEAYRLTVFFISLLGFVFFYFTLKIKFENINKINLLLIASILLLSPFYRTSAYWALNENYGLIAAILSSLFLNLYYKCNSLNLKKNYYIFITIFFSSITVYFDQKLIIVPLICFFSIISSNQTNKIKLLSFFIYTILSIPFLFLMIHWGGIVPQLTQLNNPNTITNIERISDLYFINIVYASTMIAFYILPFIFFSETGILQSFKLLLKNRISVFLILISIIFSIYLFLYFDFKTYTVDDYWIGLGIVNKISHILFENILIKEIFTYIAFIISNLIILLFLRGNFNDLLIVFYYFLISILLWPLMQEYFDPSIFLITFLFFKTKIKINNFNTLMIFLYYSVFLVGSNIYYNS